MVIYMKYRLENKKEFKISNDEFLKIKQSLDLYDMYLEYTKESERKELKIKQLEEKLVNNKDEAKDYIEHKNIVKNQSQSSKLIVSLREELNERYIIKNEYESLLNKFKEIDAVRNIDEKNRLIEELDVRGKYTDYKNLIKIDNEKNNKLIERITNEITKIEENVNIVDINELDINSEVISNFNVKINSINNKIKRNKKSIKKNSRVLKGLNKELDNILQLNNYENVEVYTNYLHNLNFIIKKY